ncbi:MAG: hypothetical protein WDW38_000310 [Sanguina aurantia]
MGGVVSKPSGESSGASVALPKPNGSDLRHQSKAKGADQSKVQDWSGSKSSGGSLLGSDSSQGSGLHPDVSICSMQKAMKTLSARALQLESENRELKEQVKALSRAGSVRAHEHWVQLPPAHTGAADSPWAGSRTLPRGQFQIQADAGDSPSGDSPWSGFVNQQRQQDSCQQSQDSAGSSLLNIQGIAELRGSESSMQSQYQLLQRLAPGRSGDENTMPNTGFASTTTATTKAHADNTSVPVTTNPTTTTTSNANTRTNTLASSSQQQLRQSSSSSRAIPAAARTGAPDSLNATMNRGQRLQDPYGSPTPGAAQTDSAGGVDQRRDSPVRPHSFTRHLGEVSLSERLHVRGALSPTKQSPDLRSQNNLGSRTHHGPRIVLGGEEDDTHVWEELENLAMTKHERPGFENSLHACPLKPPLQSSRSETSMGSGTRHERLVLDAGADRRPVGNGVSGRGAGGGGGAEGGRTHAAGESPMGCVDPGSAQDRVRGSGEPTGRGGASGSGRHGSRGGGAGGGRGAAASSSVTGDLLDMDLEMFVGAMLLPNSAPFPRPSTYTQQQQRASQQQQQQQQQRASQQQQQRASQQQQQQQQQQRASQQQQQEQQQQQQRASQQQQQQGRRMPPAPASGPAVPGVSRSSNRTPAVISVPGAAGGAYGSSRTRGTLLVLGGGDESEGEAEIELDYSLPGSKRNSGVVDSKDELFNHTQYYTTLKPSGVSNPGGWS